MAPACGERSLSVRVESANLIDVRCSLDEVGRSAERNVKRSTQPHEGHGVIARPLELAPDGSSDQSGFCRPLGGRSPLELSVLLFVEIDLCSPHDVRTIHHADAPSPAPGR